MNAALFVGDLFWGEEMSVIHWIRFLGGCGGWVGGGGLVGFCWFWYVSESEYYTKINSIWSMLKTTLPAKYKNFLKMRWIGVPKKENWFQRIVGSRGAAFVTEGVAAES